MSTDDHPDPILKSLHDLLKDKYFYKSSTIIDDDTFEIEISSSYTSDFHKIINTPELINKWTLISKIEEEYQIYYLKLYIHIPIRTLSTYEN